MRTKTLLPTLLVGILASASQSDPIRINLADVGTGSIGSRTFVLDMERQAEPPFDFPDVNEFSGDYIRKQDDYRINISDFFHVEMENWTGYGFNWLLERWPQDIGIFEQYAQILFFSALGGTLVLEGPWTSFWEEGSPLGATLRQGEETVSSEMRIQSLGDPGLPAVPEPGTMALFALGASALAGMTLRRRFLTHG